MKILQNESTNNSTTNCSTTSATTTTISKEKHQHRPQQNSSQLLQQQYTSEKRKAKTLKNKILQNVAQQQRQEQQQQNRQQQQLQQQNAQYFTVDNDKNCETQSSAMTDERLKSNNNKNSAYNNNSVTESKTTTKIVTTKTVTTAKNLAKDTENKDTTIGNNSSDLIIAEAAKILLKNGLNGTNVAAVATATATLLTAAANFHQLPNAVAHSLSAGNSNLETTTTSVSSSSLTFPPVSDFPPALGTNVTTASAAAHAQLAAIAAAAAVNATNHKRLAAAVSTCSTSSSLATTPTVSLSIPSSKSPNQSINNGLLDSSNNQKTKATTVSATPTSSVATTPTAHFTKPYKANSCKTVMSSASQMDVGIIDYTVNSTHTSSAATSVTSSPPSSSPSVINLSTSGNSSHYTGNTAQHKFPPNNNNNNINSHHSDIIRPPVSHQKSTNTNSHKNTLSGVGGGCGGSGYGGRLQFFKDGKFILELARSKDGEKGGWVSVPRKLFRTPSAATSSTVTPSATASTSGATISSPLATSPAAVGGGGSSSYAKNECSNSLSFSDDNSSLQSSPWQRDHCWKQAAPKRNVSQEMTLCYRRPAFYNLTTQAILLSHRKRRKPFDTKTLDNCLIYGLNIQKPLQQHQHQQHKMDKLMLNKKEVELNEEVDNSATKTIEDKPERRDAECMESCTTEDSKQQDKDAEVKNSVTKEEKNKEECGKIFDKNYTKTEDNKKADHDDVEMSKISSPCKKESKSIECPNIHEDDTKKEEHEIEKMNTSDCTDEEASSTQATSVNGKVSKEEEQQDNASKAQVEKIKTGDEKKRLKKYEHYKTRAKLTTIVQKLLETSTSRLTATAQSFKVTTNQTAFLQAASTTFTTTSNLSSAGTDSAKKQNSKNSPPSNTAASRLVEYHQQHVSPRKRILREFEKVSLEDSTTGAAGGKRSRAKNNNTNSASSSASSVNVTMSSTSASNKSMSLNTHNSNLGNISKSSEISATCNNPTKLYSSYSIHSLLGGSVSSPQSSSSSASAMSASTKMSTNFPATITSSTMTALSPYHANISPKSPERNSLIGGKSPSNSATKSKRSPPYSSPMYETQSKSPISAGIGVYSDYVGRKSPRSIPDPAHNAFNKMRYASSGGTSSDSTASSINHHLHTQQNYHHQPQTYYSPYMVSPHYVPPLSGSSSLSPNTSSLNTQSSSAPNSRSPRQHTSAFRATTPTSAAFTTNTTHNIPSTQRGDLSPQRSTTSSPRETTPRTVPKKTASIRRQFASPTSTTQYHNSSNCSSPTMTLECRSEDHQVNNDRRTPVSSSTSHQQHQQPQTHLMQRSSPGNPNIAGSPIHPYSYMYAHPPNGGNSPHTSNVTGSNLPSSSISPSTANAAAAAAAAAASYIPAVVGSPYYHPYISTLAAMRHPQMWMQHYQSAVAAAANPALMQSRHGAMLSAASAAARLSPPYHGFQYNGVGNAAAAIAAAAAAAGFGSTSNPPHHSSNTLSHSSSVFNPLASSNLHGMQYSTTALQAAGLVSATASAALTSATSMTDTTDLSKSSKNSYPSTSTSLSTVESGGVVAHSNLPSLTGSTENSVYTISNKDEQSSDVPLNLSKH